MTERKMGRPTEEPPYFFIGRVEYVRAVLMRVNPLNPLLIHVAAEMRSFVNHQHRPSALPGAMGERRPVKT